MEFAKDKRCRLQWLSEAKRRHRPVVLNNAVTPHHIGSMTCLLKPLQARTLSVPETERNSVAERRGAVWFTDRAKWRTNVKPLTSNL
ncbi:MAG: hypothetical protein V2B19_06035 [Pseudomonadota bacterium]